MKDKNPCKFRVFDGVWQLLKMKAKCAGNPEFTRIRIVQVISPPVKIEPKDLKDIPDTQGVLPINLVRRSDKRDIGRCAQGSILR